MTCSACSCFVAPCPQPLASNLTSYLILSSTFVADGEHGAAACYMAGLACTLGLLAQVRCCIGSHWVGCGLISVFFSNLVAACTVPRGRTSFTPGALLSRLAQVYHLNAVPVAVFWPAAALAAASMAANSAKLAGWLDTAVGAAAWRLWRGVVGCAGWAMLPQVGCGGIGSARCAAPFSPAWLGPSRAVILPFPRGIDAAFLLLLPSPMSLLPTPADCLPVSCCPTIGSLLR